MTLARRYAIFTLILFLVAVTAKEEEEETTKSQIRRNNHLRTRKTTVETAADALLNKVLLRNNVEFSGYGSSDVSLAVTSHADSNSASAGGVSMASASASASTTTDDVDDADETNAADLYYDDNGMSTNGRLQVTEHYGVATSTPPRARLNPLTPVIRRTEPPVEASSAALPPIPGMPGLRVTLPPITPITTPPFFSSHTDNSPPTPITLPPRVPPSPGGGFTLPPSPGSLTLIPFPDFTPLPIPAYTAPPFPDYTAPPIPQYTAPPIPDFTAPPIPDFTAPPFPDFTASPVTSSPFESSTTIDSSSSTTTVDESSSSTVGDNVFEQVNIPGFPNIDIPEIPEELLNYCFSGSTLVHVQHKGLVEMQHLQIGDFIAVPGGKKKKKNVQFERIYSFGHYEPDAKAALLEVRTNMATPALQISMSHLLFVKGHSSPIPASSLNVGDRLEMQRNNDDDETLATITSLKKIKTHTGLFAPFTPSGTFLVNDGIAVSSYVALQQDGSKSSSFWQLGSMISIIIPHHWASHAFEIPHRMVCHHFGRTCLNEKYIDGISTWAYTPRKLFRQISRTPSESTSSAMTTLMILVPLVVILALLWTMEQMYLLLGGGRLFLLLLLLVLGFYHRSSSRRRKKQNV